MSKENILIQLTEGKLVTAAQLTALQHTDTDRQFLTTLLDIYANKISNYIRMCQRKVGSYLRARDAYPRENIEAMTMQHIIESTYSHILEIDKTSILPTLLMLLQKTAPSLAISLGMATMHKEGDAPQVFYNLNQQITIVFVKYLARYQLVRDVATADLQELCVAVEEQAPELFPSYLLQSLVHQQTLSSLLQRAIAEYASREPNTTALWARELANSIRTEPRIFRRCLSGILKYFCICIKSTQLDPALQDLLFNHLQDEAQMLPFIELICGEYIARLSSSENLERIFTENQARATTELCKLCLSAFPLLGIKILKIDESQVAAKKSELAQGIAALEAQKLAINSRVAADIELRRAALENGIKSCSEQIASGVASARQKAEEAIATARANFKPRWEVGGFTSFGGHESIASASSAAQASADQAMNRALANFKPL